MMYSKAAALVALARYTCAQQPGNIHAEQHPPLNWQQCDAGGCTTQDGSVVIDANWRWVYKVGSNDMNCYTNATWNDAACSSNQDCATNCALDGVQIADYETTYGVSTNSDSLKLNFVTKDPTTSNINVGSRMFLLDSQTEYHVFKLVGNEFSFDVDVTNLGCGVNGALYFASMDPKGSMTGANQAGAAYGTGYFDSQCPKDLKFVNGQANFEGWTPVTDNIGTGNIGACGVEFDVWEANSMSTAMTAHNCKSQQKTCQGTDCQGQCDPSGCDFNTYRLGDTTFYGMDKADTVDTSSVFTVLTQFITDSNNTLTEIKRFYIQNGNVIPNAQSKTQGVTGNSLTDGFCKSKNDIFQDKSTFSGLGGMAAMGKAMDNGMVLVMSVWDDHKTNMLWLDSTMGSGPGAVRGSCPTDSGVPSAVEGSQATDYVTFSNIKFGPIGSTQK